MLALKGSHSHPPKKTLTFDCCLTGLPCHTAGCWWVCSSRSPQLGSWSWDQECGACGGLLQAPAGSYGAAAGC